MRSGFEVPQTISSIHQLNIIGVRSFDNQGTGQNITFKAPLTLIVGYNGSGKTTIIESLKYAATGQFPPNAGKSGAFIHDPKLAGDPEVLARVKMSFFNAQGHKLVISRRVSVTVKKDGKYTQKTLDSNLVIRPDEGDRQSISSTRLKMDEAVPIYLGVTPAILENVIFCHQEDSLWPMSEPAKLKVKFDEIFQAEKFTKAIDSLNKLKKDYATTLKVLENEEKNSKENNNKAKKFYERMEKLHSSIESKREKFNVLRKDIVEAEKLRNEKDRLSRAALGIVETLKAKEERASNIQIYLDNLQENLEERDEPDEWLEKTLAEFDTQMRQYTQKNDGYKKQYMAIQESERDTQEQLNGKNTEKGQHVAQKEQHEADLQSRAEMVKDAATAHSLRGYDGDLDEDAIKEFLGRIQSMNLQKDKELTRTKDATLDQVRQHQVSITEIENRKASRSQEKQNAKDQLKANEKTIKGKQSDMDLIDMTEGTKAALDATYNDLQESLKKAQSNFASSAWDRQLDREKRQLRELEEELTRLNQELIQKTKTMQDTAALDLAKDEAQQARRALDTMVSTYGEQLNTIVGNEWALETLQREYNSAVDGADQSLADAKAEKDGVDRVYNEHNFKLKALKADLAKKNSEMEHCNSALLASITRSDGNPIATADEYLQELHALEEERDEAQKELDSMSYVSEFYKKALDTVEKQNCCRLCERSFASQTEKRSAAGKLNKLLEKYVKEKLEADLKSMAEDLKKAQKVRPKYDIWKKLYEVDIPAVKKEIQLMEDKSQNIITRGEQKDQLVREQESRKQEVNGFRNTVHEITRLSAEIAKQEERVTRFSSQRTLSGSPLTLPEIQAQQEACNEQIRAAKVKVDKVTADKDAAKTEISDIERQSSSFSNKVNAAKYQLEKKRDLAETIKNLQDNNTLQNETIKSITKHLESMEPDLAKARAQRDDAQRRGDAKADMLQAEKNKLGQTVNKLNLIEANINNYLNSGGTNKLAACDRAITALEDDLERLKSEREGVTAKINEIGKLITNSNNTKRSIQDTISYRKSLKQMREVQKEITDLKSRDSATEYARLKKEAGVADHRLTLLKAEQDTLSGSIHAEDDQFAEYENQWDVDYKGAAEKWRADNVKVQTNRAAVSDLIKCMGALDKAIIQFHTMKMEEVNTIAAELWRSTYQGTDVDTIMIKSEKDETVRAGLNSRKYNYRLVMVKQDAELDMRGRCSAGQKVLASIIIRLALAESFGTACGVIALDEPTTNLDTDNIKALARSLNQIIKSRKHQKNFQLIIITHDEAFIREMKCREFTDEYWRISRNAAQNSEIHRQNLSLIDED